MKIYFASDHAGYELKGKLIPFVKELGYEVEDCGAHQLNPEDDYPEFVKKAAQKVNEDPKNNRAIVLGKTGQGEAITANKFPKVRATVFYGSTPGKSGYWAILGSLFIIFLQNSKKIIKLSREHNDANVLSLGAEFLSTGEAKKAVKIWLETPFSNEERHKRRISDIEN